MADNRVFIHNINRCLGTDSLYNYFPSFFYLINCSMSNKFAQEKGYVNLKFIMFLKTTLGKMMATNTIASDMFDLNFWHSWPKKYYNSKCFDNCKGFFHKEKESDLEQLQEQVADKEAGQIYGKQQRDEDDGDEWLEHIGSSQLDEPTGNQDSTLVVCIYYFL